MSHLDQLDHQNLNLTNQDFKTIIDELKIHSNCVHHQLNDLLYTLSQIKYQNTIQRNAKKHLFKKLDVNQVIPTVKVEGPKSSKYQNHAQIGDGTANINKSNHKVFHPKQSVLEPSVIRDSRFKKIWMTHKIYHMIQVRKSFNFALKLYPESAYLKAQHRFYEQAVYKAVDHRKSIFYARKPLNVPFKVLEDVPPKVHNTRSFSSQVMKK